MLYSYWSHIFYGSLITLAFYIPVFIDDLIDLISMGYDLLFGFDIDYSISTLTKFWSPLFMMGLGKTIQEWDQIHITTGDIIIVLEAITVMPVMIPKYLLGFFFDDKIVVILMYMLMAIFNLATLPLQYLFSFIPFLFA